MTDEEYRVWRARCGKAALFAADAISAEDAGNKELADDYRDRAVRYWRGAVELAERARSLWVLALARSPFLEGIQPVFVSERGLVEDPADAIIYRSWREAETARLTSKRGELRIAEPYEYHKRCFDARIRIDEEFEKHT